jgi:hypothetical protein
MQFSRLSMITTTSYSELSIVNNTYPYIYGIIGTSLNLILLTAYLKRKNKIYQKRGCGVVVSTSEHHAGGMGSNPTPRK